MGIGIVADQVIGDSIDDPLRNLRPTRTIEKHGGMSIHFLRQRRKLCANPGQIEGGACWSPQHYRVTHMVSQKLTTA
jgi:poly(A) polymerase Pap1